MKSWQCDISSTLGYKTFAGVLSISEIRYRDDANFEIGRLKRTVLKIEGPMLFRPDGGGPGRNGAGSTCRSACSEKARMSDYWITR
jgi:hypothetical protein